MEASNTINYIVCDDFISHTSLNTLRYASVADYYFARRHIVVHLVAVVPLGCV